MKILKYPNYLDWIRHIYDKSLWVKLRTITKRFKEVEEPSMAHFMTIGPVIITICVTGLIIKGKYFTNLTPKYYPYINIYRPDDPDVAKIRTDESVLIAPYMNKFSLHKQKVVR